MRLGYPLFALAVVGAFSAFAQPWCVAVSISCIAGLCVDAVVAARGEVKEARILALEDALEKLKGTAVAVLKVEARTSAVERAVAAALRADHD